MKSKLLLISKVRNRYLLLLDCCVVAFMPVVAFWIRTEDLAALSLYGTSLFLFATTMVWLKGAIFFRMGLYAQYWPYASDNELRILLAAMVAAFASELFVSLGFLYPFNLLTRPLPRSLPFIDAVMTVLFIGGVRLGIKLLHAVGSSQKNLSIPRPVIIAGAGVAGMLVMKELQLNAANGLLPVALVDDDPDKIGKKIHGVSVLGPFDRLPSILEKYRTALVIIAMPAVGGEVIRKIVLTCKACGVESKTIPNLFEILRGTAKVQQLRDIRVEDLLRRGVIKTDAQRVASLVKHGRVMVTGAGGSIGSEICRQIKDFGPEEIILVGHGENSIFSIAKELNEYPRRGQKVSSVVADIRDPDRMEQVLKQFHPSIIFHAAAHKHVGLMEENYADAVLNNVLGTKNILDMAARHSVQHFVMISSDKAVNPTSIMGVTKRIAELLVQEAAVRTRKNYVIVRFGNVLGSRGSVVPIFQHQIETGGPITVTHPEVRRFFMTIPEAVQLVLQASAMGYGGEVFVLDMGEQIKVADLVRDMLKLHGLTEGKDIQIIYTGLLPGEKMREEIFYEGGLITHTGHEKILMCSEESIHTELGISSKEGRTLQTQVHDLIAAAQQGEKDVATDLMRAIVPQYSPPAKGIYEAAVAYRTEKLPGTTVTQGWTFTDG